MAINPNIPEQIEVEGQLITNTADPKWIDGGPFNNNPTFNIDDPSMWTPMTVMSGLASGFCERAAYVNQKVVGFPTGLTWTPEAAPGVNMAQASTAAANLALGHEFVSVFSETTAADLHIPARDAGSNYMSTFDVALSNLIEQGGYVASDTDGITPYTFTTLAASASSRAHAAESDLVKMPEEGGTDYLAAMGNAFPAEWAKERKWMLDELKYTQGIGRTVPRMDIEYYGFRPDDEISSSYGTVKVENIYPALYSSQIKTENLNTNDDTSHGMGYTLSDGSICTTETRIPAFILGLKRGSTYEMQIRDGLCAYTDCTLNDCAPDPVWNETTDYNSAFLIESAVGGYFSYWPAKYINDTVTLSAYPGLNSAGYLEHSSRESTEEDWDENADWISAAVGGTVMVTGTTTTVDGVQRILGATVTVADITLFADCYPETGKTVTLTGVAEAGESSLYISSASPDDLSRIRISCEPIVIDTAYRLTVDSEGSLFIDPSWKFIYQMNVVDGGKVFYHPNEANITSAEIPLLFSSAFYNYAHARTVSADDDGLVYSSGVWPTVTIEEESVAAQLPATVLYGQIPTIASTLPHSGSFILDNGVWAALPHTTHPLMLLTGGAVLYDFNDNNTSAVVISSGCLLNVVGGGAQYTKPGYANGVYHGVNTPNVYVLSGGTCRITAPGRVLDIVVASGGTCILDGIVESDAYLISSSYDHFASDMAIQSGATLVLPTMKIVSSGVLTNKGDGEGTILGCCYSTTAHTYLRNTLLDVFDAYAWQNIDDSEDLWYTARDIDDIRIGDIVYWSEQFRRDADPTENGLNSFALITNIQRISTTEVRITFEYTRQQHGKTVIARRYTAGDVGSKTAWKYRDTEASTDSDWKNVYYDNNIQPNGYILSSGDYTLFKETITGAEIRSTNLIESSLRFYAFNNFGLMTVQGGTLETNGLTRGWNTMNPIQYGADDYYDLDVFGIDYKSIDSTYVFLCGTTVAATAVTNAKAATNVGLPAGALPADFYGAKAAVPEIRNRCQVLAIKPSLGGVINHYSSFRCRQFYVDPDSQTQNP